MTYVSVIALLKHSTTNFFIFGCGFTYFFQMKFGVLRDIHPWKEILCFYHMVKIHHFEEITCSYIRKRDKQWMPLTSYVCSQKASQILCCQASSKYLALERVLSSLLSYTDFQFLAMPGCNECFFIYIFFCSLRENGANITTTTVRKMILISF